MNTALASTASIQLSTSNRKADYFCYSCQWAYSTWARNRILRILPCL